MAKKCSAVIVALLVAGSDALFGAQRWRDQFIRFSPRIIEAEQKAARRLSRLSPEEAQVETELRKGRAAAARAHMARALRQRNLMSVDYDCGAPDCSGGLTIHSEQKGSTYLSEQYLTNYDCPWQGLLNTEGLCLPYQELTLPYGDLDEQRNAGSLVCPSAGKYHDGEKVALGDNYGCAAPRPAWPADDMDSVGNALPLSPICKTYIDDCKYSVSSTRKYTSKYTINHLLLSVGLASEASDTGKYPSAGTKGDDSEDGECTKADAAAQWLDCGIPCPVGDNARMEAEDMRGFGGAVLGFMGLCGILGGLAFKFVGGSSERFFVAGRSMPLVVVTATLASQSLDSNAALGNIDLGYYYHWQTTLPASPSPCTALTSALAAGGMEPACRSGSGSRSS